MRLTKSAADVPVPAEDLALLEPDPTDEELALPTPEPEVQLADEDDGPIMLTLSDMVGEPDPVPEVVTSRKEIERGPDNRIVRVTTYCSDGTVTVQQVRRDQNHRVAAVDATETREAAVTTENVIACQVCDFETSAFPDDCSELTERDIVAHVAAEHPGRLQDVRREALDGLLRARSEP